MRNTSLTDEVAITDASLILKNATNEIKYKCQL